MRRRKLPGHSPDWNRSSRAPGFRWRMRPAEDWRGIPQARAILIQAQRTFPKETIIAYNLACYDCQLGDLDAAIAWLDKGLHAGQCRPNQTHGPARPGLETAVAGHPQDLTAVNGPTGRSCKRDV